MAIYHFAVKVISRADGRSAVAAAAYRAAAVLRDDRVGRSHDFSNKAGVVHSEILLPDGAPARWLDQATLWNEVEAGEKRKDAQLAREVEFALPRELTRAQAIALARDFVRGEFVARGMVADLNVHWGRTAEGEFQPHAHVMLALREVVPGPGGEGGFGAKERAWNDRALLRQWRERWAELVNERLAELGHDIRIDHRSYAEQGIGLEPQYKIGPAGSRRRARGEEAERAAEHDAIARRNGERIIADPGVVLAALTRQQSTFSRRDLARWIARHTDGAEQFADAMAKVEASAELVRLGKDGRGQDRFSTREMLSLEQRMEAAAAALAGAETHRVLRAPAWRAVQAAARDGIVLGGQQRAAHAHLTTGRDLSVVIGYAGTGKSTLLGVARQAWAAEGYRVSGAALSGIAAEGLEAGSGIASRTVHSLLFAWEQGREQLTARDVLVVDEAGMIGSRQMERLLSAAQAAGAKIVLVGDPEQLQAIEAGAALRAIAERVGAVEITEVRRQLEAWQQDATRELATGRTEAALARYAAAGMVVEHATQDAAKDAIIAQWEAARRERPEVSQIILAHTRADVAALNARARAVRQAAGELDAEQVLATERGARAFAAGDRLYFLRNDRGLGVKNGTLGTVERIEDAALAAEQRVAEISIREHADEPTAAQSARLTVTLDDGRRVSFDLAEYAHIDHGYAATVHKSQGVTVDRAHVLATRGLDRHAAYVGLSRHRESVSLHWSTEEMGSREGLVARLGRERLKDTSLDYGVAAAETEAERQTWAESAADSARAYAARRGLAPDSEIVVHAEQVAEREAAREAEAPRKRQSRFAGLRLGGTARLDAAEPPRETPALAQAPARPGRETELDRLEQAAAAYARAWADVARMRRAELPVLPHQRVALGQAARTLDGLSDGVAQDLHAALTRQPTLAERIETAAERFALLRAAEQTRRERLALEKKARETVRAWHKLEQAYGAARKQHDYAAQRELGPRLEAMAQAVKQTPALNDLLRQRGPELGVAEGSRLARVVQAKELSRSLVRELQLHQAQRLSRGMGMGR